MATPTVATPVNFSLVLYPETHENLIKQSTGSTHIIREIMKRMLEVIDNKAVANFDEFKTIFDGYVFESDAARTAFFDNLSRLQKITGIDKWSSATEDDLRHAGQQIVENLPADHLYKILSTDTAAVTAGYAPMNVVDLALHVLYNAHVLHPLCDPPIAYAACLDKTLHGRFSAMITAIAKNAGAEALVPVILFNEWQAAGAHRLLNSVAQLQNQIVAKNEEIEQLRKDVVSFKAQSSGSSQYSWEA
jgi:hypothetical protein